MTEHERIVAFGYDPPDTAEDVIREEIVRCRDCRHFEFGEVHMFDGRRLRRPSCARMEGCLVATEPDGFCWRGARRES